MKKSIILTLFSLFISSQAVFAGELHSGLYVWDSGEECKEHITTHVEFLENEVYFDFENSGDLEGSYDYWVGMFQLNSGSSRAINYDPLDYTVDTSTRSVSALSTGEVQYEFKTIRHSCVNSRCDSGQILNRFYVVGQNLRFTHIEGRVANCMYNWQ